MRVYKWSVHAVPSVAILSQRNKQSACELISSILATDTCKGGKCKVLRW